MFGPGVPSEYQKLAEACWAQTAEERPSADEVVTKLQVGLTDCAAEVRWLLGSQLWCL